MTKILGIVPTKAVLFIEETKEALEFDASNLEEHRKTAEITKHPVEKGASISDHYRVEPDEISMNVIVSNDPPIVLKSLRIKPVSGFDDPNSRAEDTYEFLSIIMNKGQTVGVSTTFRSYASMGITSLSVERDAESGNVANINMNLVKIPTATTQSVAPPAPSNPGRKEKDKNGDKPKSKPTSAVAEKSSSTLFDISESTGGLIGSISGLFGFGG